jgi:hypothetical protein
MLQFNNEYVAICRIPEGANYYSGIFLYSGCEVTSFASNQIIYDEIIYKIKNHKLVKLV